MKELTIRSVDPFSIAKIYGLLCTAIGLLIGVLYGVILLVIGAAEEEPALLGAALGVVCLGPFLYGAMGFVSGLIGGFLYNLCAGWVGGVRFTVDEQSA